jgi:ribonuclease G
LFDDLESDIDGLVSPRVQLACGGWITIEGTEALTAIDVNSGSFTRASAIEDTGLAVNLEAAAEIGRQIRLRGIGGMIVIDFIHMLDAGHVERVHQALSDSLLRDTTPFNIGPLTQLGLTEVTRKRVREPLVEMWTEPCATCGGFGHASRIEAVALDIIRCVERTARMAPGKVVEIRAAPEVASWLEEQGARTALARRGVASLQIMKVESSARERFEVGTIG